MSTPSTPRPREKAIAAATGSSPRDKSTVSAPSVRASSNFCGSKSMPITLHPCARNNCTVTRPMSPSPVTTKVSPSVGCVKRIPCKAMAPITVNAAASSLTVSGILAHKFVGTHTTSACLPLDATRSPTENPVTPAPTCMTTPTLQ